MTSYGRFFIPAVRLELADGTVIENLDGSGLRMEWGVERDGTNNPDTAEVTVYNLSPSVASKIHNAWRGAQPSGRFLTVLSIGWDHVPVQLFVGDTWEMSPNRRATTDMLTTFRLGDGTKPLKDSVIGRNFHKVAISAIMSYLVELPPNDFDNGGGGLGLKFPKESKALIDQAAAELSEIPTFGNIPIGLSTKEAIDRIVDTLGLQWRVHNDAFIVMRNGSLLKAAVRIQPQTGLLEYTATNDGGVEFSALADPRIEPGLQVLVTDDNGRPFGEPAYRVDKVSFSGDTSGNSLMQVLARKVTLL